MKAQVMYYSKVSATDFTALSSWGTAIDGTGASPTSISNADNFVIQNGSAMVLPANASVRQLTINSGSLTVAANMLTVSIANANNSNLTINSGGTLTVSGGTLNVNGNIFFASGSNFNQSSGSIVVDGNSGVSATSVPITRDLFGFGSNDYNYSTGIISVTGGNITIVNPHFSGNVNGAAFAFRGNTIGRAFSSAHTTTFGPATQPSTANYGYYVDCKANDTLLMLGNVNISGGTGSFAVQTDRGIGEGGLNCSGNLNISAGAELLDINSNSHEGISVGGNFTNDGIFTQANTAGLKLGLMTGTKMTTLGASPNPQTISGSGVFRNSTTSSTANFTSLTINNSSAGGVNFSNSNSLLSGGNIGTVSDVFKLDNGVINTGSNTFVLGVSRLILGTLSYTVGGFGSGSTFSRWYGFTGLGTTIAAVTIPTAGAGTYPFVMGNPTTGLLANHFHRATSGLTTPGQLAVKFNGGTGTSAITPITEGSLTYDRQTNASWVVTTSAGYAASVAHTFAIQGQGTYVTTSDNIVVLNNGSLVGTAQTGINQPMGQRINIPASNVAATYTLGAIASQFPIESAQSGPWESASTWVGGVVPSCANAAILSGHTVNIFSSTTATPNSVIINTGGVLAVTGGSTTVGCTNNNNNLTNNGTINVSGGNIIINGNINNISGSTFTQSGGDIKIDGNNAGNTATSVAAGISIVNIATGNVTLTGGTMTVVDPHAANSATSYAFSYFGETAIDNTAGWTLKFGDGSSTDAGGVNASSVGGFVWNNAGSKIYFDNVIIDGALGTNRYVSSYPTTIGINTLTINATGELRMAAEISIAGNFTNNGIFTQISTANLSFQNFKNATVSASTIPQTISGTGVFRDNTVTANSKANFTSIKFNNSSSTGVTFADANSLLSGANTGTVSGRLTITTGFINIGSNTFILGTGPSDYPVPILLHTEGGFTAGSSFAKWWSTGAGGGNIFPAQTTTGGGVFPFATGTASALVARNLYLNQTTFATTGGKITVKYNDIAGTDAVSIVDGAYTVDTQTKSNWAVSQSGITGTPTYSMAINGQDIYGAANGNSRITLASAPAFGVHQIGTNYVNAQRTGIPLANLAGTYYLGIASSDVAFVSVANGDWGNAATWNKGTVPTCNDIVQIAANTNVTVNSVGNVAKNITIKTGGTLTQASGDLTVGCTLKNNFITNNGTLTISGGILNINGNINNAKIESVFNQSGGTVKIDGNNAGVAANSVASDTPLFNSLSNNINLTGGTLLFVDPHVATISTSGYTIRINNAIATTATLATSPDHITQFGDGLSTDAGGHTDGFLVNSSESVAFLCLGSIVVNGGSGTNRNVSSIYDNLVATGDVTVNANSRLSSSGLTVGKNLLVNPTGIYDANSLMMAKLVSVTEYNSIFGPSTVPQTITNNGIIRNPVNLPAANLIDFKVINSSAEGVTLNSPISISGSLTLTQGFINTTNTNLLTLGTALSAAGLNGGSANAYIRGPFARTITAASSSFYTVFPVGKTTYAPISLAPIGGPTKIMKVEAFDTNSGTASATVQNLSATRRWEAPLISGSFSTIYVILGDNAITNLSLPVMAPTAGGVYDSIFGTTSIYVAGTPNTTQSATALAAANYTGFLSYAEIASVLSTNETASIEKAIKVYPNPFVDILNISDVKNVKSISVIDVLGRLVKTFDKAETALDLRELTSGIYLVVLNMKDGSKQTIKTIKK
ncbi:hypothetical protein ASG22_06220 [Chryseobacterium sp. Leaf405]|nr:hypothetical protein ASG22_06220 [Chryseobacterium sp. Leaf405]